MLDRCPVVSVSYSYRIVVLIDKKRRDISLCSPIGIRLRSMGTYERTDILRAHGMKNQELVSVFKEKTKDTLWPPQADAIKIGALEGKNLVIVAPTSSGKTLISEIIMTNVADRGGKVLYLCPLKALAEEKFRQFRRDYARFLSVAISTSDHTEYDSELAAYNVLIAVYEKADSLLRKNLTWFDDLGLVVVDEAQKLNDEGRGPDLEILLTAFKKRLPDCQFVLLTAALQNPDQLSKWLDGETLVSKWRPTMLVEGVFCRNKIEWNNGTSLIFPEDEFKEIPYEVSIPLSSQGKRARLCPSCALRFL